MRAETDTTTSYLVSVCIMIAINKTTMCIELVQYRLTVISTDNDNRPKLKPIPGNREFLHDYINASYIDVSTVSRG